MNRTGDQVRHDQALRVRIRDLLHSIPCSTEGTVLDVRTWKPAHPAVLKEYECSDYDKAQAEAAKLRKEQEAAEKTGRERLALEAQAKKERERAIAAAKRQENLERRQREEHAKALARAARAAARKEEAERVAEIRRSARLEALLEREREKERKRQEAGSNKPARKPAKTRKGAERKAPKVLKALPVPGDPKRKKCPHCDYTATYTAVYGHVWKHLTPPEGAICDFGCGQPGKFYATGGRVGCCETGKQCPAVRAQYANCRPKKGVKLGPRKPKEPASSPGS